MSGLRRNHQYKIHTPTGFQDFLGVRKLEKLRHFIVTLNTGIVIKCSDTHPFVLDGIEICANELYAGCKLDSSDEIDIYVKSLDIVDSELELFDIIGVAGGSVFNVDGIVSHNCDFVTSGNTVIEGSILEWYQENHVKDPLERRGFDANIWVWEPPDYSKSYLVTADVARGDGSDYSAFHIIEIESMTQVAEYRGLIGTKEYGNMLVNIATEYNDALLVIENASMGWAAIQPAIDRNYKNLYYSAKDLTVVDVQHQLNSGYDLKGKDKLTPGFTMSPKIRPLVVSKLQSYMHAKDPVIRSQRTIDEMFVFIWKGSRPEAAGGYNDDLVTSFATAMWVRDTALLLRKEGIELQKKALTGFTKGGQVGSGADQFQYGQNPWKMQVGNEEEDLTWLIR